MSHAHRPKRTRHPQRHERFDQPLPRIHLAAVEWRVLERRVERLRQRRATLSAALERGERNDDLLAEHLRVRSELWRLDSILAGAASIIDTPDDPQVVELGDRVELRHDDGTTQAYVIVSSASSIRQGHHMISLDSPLGRALVDRRVGDIVDVIAPSGAYRCEILSATRPSA